jgi:protoporphyrinogen oxidase
VLDFVIRMMSEGAISLPAGGVGAIPRQLAARLPEGAVRYGAPVAAVADGQVTLRTGVQVEVPAVVVATDGPTAAALLGKSVADPGSRAVTCLYFAAPEPPLRGPWLVLNGESGELVQNLVALDQVAPGYAPAGSSLISATLLGDAPWQEQELLRRVRAQLSGWFGAAVGSWRHLATYRIHHAQPAQSPGYRAQRPDSPRLRRGVYLAGDWLTDASINGALLSGRRAAEALLADR